MRPLPIAAVAAAGGLLLLAACAPEVESEIYVSDVLKVGGGGAPIVTPALFRIPQPGEDECKKGLDGLIERLSALAPTTGKGQCIEKDGDELAEIETSMVIAAPGADIPKPNLFVLEVAPADAGASAYTLTIRLLDSIETISDALAADSDQLQTDFDPAHFLFTLTNDGASAIAVTANQVFVDGEPALPEMGARDLERRASIEIKLSDVASVHVERANSYAFATIGAD
jgi:hypothetical protein